MPTEGLPLWSRFLRRSARIVGALLAIVLLFLLIVYAINSVDEDLTPEAKAMRLPPINPYAGKDNIYIALAGFNAPAGQSMADAGEVRIRLYNETADARMADPRSYLDELRSRDELTLKFNGTSGQCHSLDGSAWKNSASRAAVIATDLIENRELFARYQFLHTLTGYYDTARPGPFVPLIAGPYEMRCLFLYNVALMAHSTNESDVRRALSDLSADLQLWRRVLTGDGKFISKMTSAAFIHSDLTLLAEIIADPAFDMTRLDDSLLTLIEPFPIDDWKIGKVFAAESQWIVNYLQNTHSQLPADFGGELNMWMTRPSDALERQMLKTRATDNLLAQIVIALQRFADANPANFTRSREELNHWMASQIDVKSPRILYNPSGKMLISIVVSTYLEHPAQVFDVAAFQRLVRLAYEIRRKEVMPVDVPDFMRRHPDLATHPIDNVPFIWDAKLGTIAIKTVGRQAPGRRFSVAL